MPSALRSRLAFVALLGAFLIPIGMSSLRGLTHVLTCQERAEAPFTLTIPEQGRATVTTSLRLTRDGPAALCGGLDLDLRARDEGGGRVTMIVAIANETDDPWRGTVKLAVGPASIPVGIGEIDPRATARDEVLLTLDPGRHDLTGSLLLGP